MYWSYEYIINKYAPEVKDKWTVKEIVEATEHLGDKVYLVYAPTGREYTYRESNEIANKYAHSFARLGLKKGDRVGIYLPNSPEYIFVLFALAKLGLIQVPINPDFQDKEITYMVNSAEIKTIITSTEIDQFGILNKVERETDYIKNIIYVDAIENKGFKKKNLFSLIELSKEASDKNPDVEVTGSDPIYIMFTSGTTGPPKGAITSNKTAIYAALMMGATNNKDYRNYTCLPLFHANAQCYSTFGMRALGGTLVLDKKFSASNFFNQINKYKVDTFNTIGGMMQILDSIYSTENVPTHSAKSVFVGGTSKDLWERFENKFNIIINEAYSMTEFPAGMQNIHPDKKERRVGSCGKPLFEDLEKAVKIVDANNNEIKVGTGELLVKGEDFLTLGYWNNPDATKNAYAADGWFKTGDILRVDEDGYYYFVDRNKFMIRVGGENISAFEIEEVINSHPNVKQCAAIPVDDIYKGEEIKVFIIPQDDIQEMNFKDIVEFCFDKLAYHKTPRYFELVDDLPRTPTQKLQKHPLKEQEKSRKHHGWDRNIEFANWKSLVFKH
ncbi:AMP-binding protein [Lentibacillus sp. N15]|uniref:class I adenylate-forming enzyme family protein n=1 Tax=Lentibacillus songyuanensis TaxID=3136161 RepID=UPI0031BADF4A